MKQAIGWLALGIAAAASQPAQAQNTDLRLKQLAANCAACHGTDGHAAPGAAVPGLAGYDRDAFVAAMAAFKSGARPATIMHQIAKGYSDAQIAQLAAYFAQQQK
jgi:cytochrome c553